MATMNTKAQSNEDWLARGKNTFVNPNGNNDVAWVVEPTKATANKNSMGQTYAQGTFHDVGNGKGISVYDGAQNILGWVYGDGSMESASPDYDNTEALRSAYDQFRANGGSLDGVSGKDEYSAASKSNALSFAENLGTAKVDSQGRIYGTGPDINSIYDAANRAAEAQAKRAYERALAGYTNAKENIGIDYYEMARRAQAKADLERANTNEVLAANGLNTGAVGQAALAQSNMLQGNLNAINMQEAQALNDIDAAIAQLRADYEGAVYEAITNNEVARAQALYEQYQAEEQKAAAQKQAILSAQQTAATEQAELARKQVDAMIKAGLTPDAQLIAAAGYDAGYVSAMAGANANKNVGGGGGGNGGGMEDVYAAIAGMSEGQKYTYLLAAGFNSAEAQEIIGYSYDMENEQNVEAELSTAGKQLLNMLQRNGADAARAAQSIQNALGDGLNGRISETDADILMKRYGF